MIDPTTGGKLAFMGDDSVCSKQITAAAGHANDAVLIIVDNFGHTAGLQVDSDDLLVNRRQQFGCNTINGRRSRMFLQFVWEATQDMTLMILIIAAVVSFGLSFYDPPETDTNICESVMFRSVIESCNCYCRTGVENNFPYHRQKLSRLIFLNVFAFSPPN